MDFEKAKALAGEVFFDRHAELPDWFNDCVSVSGFKNKNKQWVLRYSVSPTSPLKENQKWEEIRGNKVVVETNPVTGARSILISRVGPESIILFEATIDFSTAVVAVVRDDDLTALDGSAFERYGKGSSNLAG
jgi:hypothetical protein